MNQLSRTQYLVTTTARKGKREGDTALRTQVWEPSRPLSLGHPFRFVLENTAQGVRVRDLSIPFAQIQQDRPLTLTHEQIRKGEELPITDKFSIRLKAVVHQAPVFGTGRGHQISVFSCLGSFVMGSQELGTQFVGKTGEATRFVITRASNDQYRVRGMSDGVLANGRELKNGQELSLTSSEIAALTLKAESHAWRFAGVESQQFVPYAGGRRRGADLDAVQFRKAMGGAFGALALLVVLSLVWPKPEAKEEELIPAQVAKIILAQPKKQAAASSGNAAPVDNAKKAQDAKVVQAFRAQALQSSMSKLLKGGMTRLLTQSDFVAGVNPNQEAARMFDQKSDALNAPTPGANLQNKDVAVGSLGGGGAGTGVKVGYGKGDRAAVTGQGAGHVSMDLGNASVEEGLTKDEVGAVIHSHLSEVRYCYESAMLRNPEVQGKLLMNFTIGASGKVKSADVKSSTLEDPRLDDCILRRLLTWKFPNTKGGIDVAVTYPFIFKTLGR